MMSALNAQSISLGRLCGGGGGGVQVGGQTRGETTLKGAGLGSVAQTQRRNRRVSTAKASRVGGTMKVRDRERERERESKRIGKRETMRERNARSLTRRRGGSTGADRSGTQLHRERKREREREGGREMCVCVCVCVCVERERESGSVRGESKREEKKTALFFLSLQRRFLEPLPLSLPLSSPLFLSF